jgi:protein-L-isoaspartate(D-aspartate) O-methyltransferase
MKILAMPVLFMVAAACEAAAQDTQCAHEHAAMVETIRGYGRSYAALGQQGMSERVLQAMGQAKRHLFMSDKSCAIAYADMPVARPYRSRSSSP